MAFKLRSSGPFKMMGSSPAKQKDFNKTGSKASTTPGYSTTKAAKAKNLATLGDPKLEKLKATRIANTNAGKIIKFGEGSNIIADKGPIDPWSSKVKKVAKKGSKIIKKVAKKAVKAVGGKALGVAGMLMATSSNADQPTKGKGKKEYEGGEIDFTKKN